MRANAAVEYNKALRLAADNGHLEVVNRLLNIPEVMTNITVVDNFVHNLAENSLVTKINSLPGIPLRWALHAEVRRNWALIWAAGRGHLEVVKRLLQIDEVMANVAVLDNLVLREAAGRGHLEVVKHLLQIDEVMANVTVLANLVLREAAGGGHLDVVNRLLCRVNW